MLPVFATAAGLAFADRRRLIVTHLVFAVHFYAFMLAALSVVFPLLTLTLLSLHGLGVHPGGTAIDWGATAIEALLCAVYLARSSGAVYGAGPWRRWITAGVLTVSILYVLYLYRFVLFLVTIWTT